MRVQVLCFYLQPFVGTFCHLLLFFVIHRHEKQIKREQVSVQAAAEFAKEKKALNTTRLNVIPFLGCFFPLPVCLVCVSFNFILRAFVNEVCPIRFPYRCTRSILSAVRSYTSIEVRRFGSHARRCLK